VTGISRQGETLADNVKNTQKAVGTGNLQAQRDINIFHQTFGENAASISLDVEIFQEIFAYVLSMPKKPLVTSRDRTLLDVASKIVLNFSDEPDQEYVRDCYKQGLPHIQTLEPYFQGLETEQQLDITSNILDSYHERRVAGLTSSQILIDLFRYYTPREKVDDPAYQRVAKAFVLLFFEDCTIFEKTKEGIERIIVTE
jgi:hypothetical protein